ncbi:MAG: hypothetical protein ACOX1P_30215 [Thermoguttaceae bacterium]|jgi:hypothetical protein
MDDAAQLLCVVVSLTGGIYCVSLLRNSRKGAGPPRGPVKSLSKSARRKSVCAKINRFGQVLLATTFLAVAASMLAVFAYRTLPLLWKENPLDVRMRQSIATVSLPGYPPVIFKYDWTQPDRPVYSIECHSKLISDEQVRRLLRATAAILFLNLANTNVSDDALYDLDCVPNLRAINVSGTRVGDLGLRRLARLRNLEDLYLASTEITDDGLRFLADVRTLRQLYLNNTAVTNAGLEHLGGMERLKELAIENTAVTSEGVNSLKCKRPDITIVYP